MARAARPRPERPGERSEQEREAERSEQERDTTGIKAMSSQSQHVLVLALV